MIKTNNAFNTPGFILLLVLLLRVGNSLAQGNQDLFFPAKDFNHSDIAERYDYIKSHDKLDMFWLYDVIHYALDLKIYPDSQMITGKAVIQLVALTDLIGSITFDFSDLQLDSVFIEEKKVLATHSADMITIPLDNNISAGDTQSVQLYYSGRPGKGLYFRESYIGDLVVYSHNEPFDARYWFPCKDDPSDKALLDVSITLPATYEVLSNGILIEERAVDAGWKYWHWREVNPIATYLVSIAAAPYVIVEQNFTWDDTTMPLQYYVYEIDVEKGEEALTATGNMLAFYSNYIGTYPFLNEKYAMSEVPFREASAMENQTATTMNEFAMDNKGLIAHELAHQWWGDALTPLSFTDIWLNEGFATYFDALFTEYELGKDALNQQMIRYASVVWQDGSLDFPIYDPPPQYWFGRAVYYKGAWVLHMLRNTVGDLVFREICRSYYNQFKYGNVSNADFIQICEQQSGKSLSTFFNQWLNFGGMPILMGEWEQLGDLVEIDLQQTQAEPVYHLDVELIVQGVERDTLIVLSMTSSSEEIVLRFSEPVVQVKIDPSNKILNRNNGPLFLIPEITKLIQVFPNPFNEIATIAYQVNKAQKVDLSIYNILGEKVIILVQDKRNIGFHIARWHGGRYSSGTYYCVLKTADGMNVKKIVLLK